MSCIHQNHCLLPRNYRTTTTNLPYSYSHCLVSSRLTSRIIYYRTQRLEIGSRYHHSLDLCTSYDLKCVRVTPAMPKYLLDRCPEAQWTNQEGNSHCITSLPWALPLSTDACFHYLLPSPRWRSAAHQCRLWQAKSPP